MPEATVLPPSFYQEVDGLLYFPRLCEKIRLMNLGTLHPDFHTNLGRGMDLWTCQFLRVSYEALRETVLSGASDAEALAWAKEQGGSRPDCEQEWFNAYLRTRGFRDDFSERLASRKREDPRTDREDILTFADYIEIDEGRELPTLS